MLGSLDAIIRATAVLRGLAGFSLFFTLVRVFTGIGLHVNELYIGALVAHHHALPRGCSWLYHNSN